MVMIQAAREYEEREKPCFSALLFHNAALGMFPYKGIEAKQSLYLSVSKHVKASNRLQFLI
jgi:hypothetical protein